MTCPSCNSALNSPRYGAIPGGGRRAAYSRCPVCRTVFDVSREIGPRRRIDLRRVA